MEFLRFCKTLKKLEETSKRLEKTSILKDLIKDQKELDRIILLVQGRVFPAWEDKKIGVAAKTAIKALSISSRVTADQIENMWRESGDLGIVAEQIFSKKRQMALFSNKLSVAKVFENVRKLAHISGGGSNKMRINLIAELFTSSEPLEARYIIRLILEDLRVGVGEGVIRDSIAWHFYSGEIEYDPDTNKLETDDGYKEFISAIQHAYNLTNDYSKVANLAKEGYDKLKGIELMPGRPIRAMLYQKAKDIPAAFEMVGKPAAFEYKYDGFRIQIHKGKEITLYTRRLEDVSAQFPDVISAVKECVKSETAVLDAEIVGLDPKSNKYLPFQKISQRIRRKYDIETLMKDFPVEVNVFDALMVGGKSLLSTPFSERRRIISEIVDPVSRKMVLSRIVVTDDPEEASRFYQEALDMGEEGVMAKSLSAIYEPGSRVGSGVKIKPVMDGLDLVITQAEWGEGKRANWLTSFTLSCNSDGELLEVGKVSTGLKELESEGVTYKHMTELLKPLIIAEKGRNIRVKPEIVIEVNFEEIQKSPHYSSGYAMRFPRFIRLRNDEREDPDSLESIERLFKNQRGRSK